MVYVGDWKGKRCCDNPRGPVVELPEDLDDEQVTEINSRIDRLEHELKHTVCDSLEATVASKFFACLSYTNQFPYYKIL